MERKDDSFPTRSSLLRRVKNTEDHQSWQEFHDIYRSLIFAFARKAGLTEDEADEVVQETMISASRHLPQFRYDPKHCSFKTWLLNLAQWRVKDQFRKRASHPIAPAHSDDTKTSAGSIEHVPAPPKDQLEAAWDSEWRAAWLNAGLAAVKGSIDAKQWQIFDLYVLKEWQPRDVARTLKISVARVYLAKHRVSALLKKEMKLLEKLAENPSC
ncbi:MAG TPA: sigma-70 family RNA polymerase sigma factor [Verrucomicrobiae bacterium]|jgi:RNA polymerase sigma-70 factor (ECF subfamily)